MSIANFPFYFSLSEKEENLSTRAKDDEEKMDVADEAAPDAETSTATTAIADSLLKEAAPVAETPLGEHEPMLVDDKEESSKKLKAEPDVQEETSATKAKDKPTKSLPPPPPPPPPPPTLSNYFSSGNGVPMIMWPKDRVIVSRLENIIQMFENKGEWPQQRALLLLNPAMSTQQQQQQQQQSLGGLSSAFSISNLVLSEQQRKLMNMSPMLAEAHTNTSSMDGLGGGGGGDPSSADLYYDYENSNNDDSEFSSHTPNHPSSSSTSRSARPKRGRPPKLDMPPGGGSSSSRRSHRGNGNGANNDMDYYSDYEADYETASDVALPPLTNGGAASSASRSKFLEPGEIQRAKTRGKRYLCALVIGLVSLHRSMPCHSSNDKG